MGSCPGWASLYTAGCPAASRHWNVSPGSDTSSGLRTGNASHPRRAGCRCISPINGYMVSHHSTAIWSRTMEAMGGEAVWQRLVGLRLAVIGVGRTGSLVATTLARLGCQHLILIDPDRIEPHNLGEMDSARWTDVSRYKVEAVVEMLRAYSSGTYTTFPVPVTANSARTACTQADVLICCVDNDAARLATAMVATCYHKILIDVGTGITLHAHVEHEHRHDDRTMGADVRLVLPGNGCLLCWGSLANFDQAVDDLLHPRPPEAQPGRHM